MSQIAIAQAIATIAHREQVDKAGLPYLGHPMRVAAALAAEWHKNPERMEELVAAAWLHDVIEDSDITENDLMDAGVKPVIVDAVVALTILPKEPRDHYYARVKESWIAVRVKRADVADNSDPKRLALLDDSSIVRLVKKYAEAMGALA